MTHSIFALKLRLFNNFLCTYVPRLNTGLTDINSNASIKYYLESTFTACKHAIRCYVPPLVTLMKASCNAKTLCAPRVAVIELLRNSFTVLFFYNKKVESLV